jgi:hypothetical protein
LRNVCIWPFTCLMPSRQDADERRGSHFYLARDSITREHGNVVMTPRCTMREQLGRPVESVESLQAGQSSRSERRVRPLRSAQPPQSAQSVQSLAPLRSLQWVQAVQSVQSNQQVRSPQTVKRGRSASLPVSRSATRGWRPSLPTVRNEELEELKQPAMP